MVAIPVQISTRQSVALAAWMEQDHPIHFYVGGTRSGKTDIATLELLLHSLGFFGADFLVASKTVGSIQRSVLPALRKYVAALGVPSPRSWRANPLYIAGNLWHFIGCDTEASQERIYGSTMAGVFIDEATRIPNPEQVIPSIVERATVPGARTILACNPGNPRHWIKKEFLPRFEASIYQEQFHPLENSFLPPEVLAMIRDLRVGAEKRRLWDGEWVAQEGAIFASYQTTDQEPIGLCDTLYVSVDPGSKDAYAAGFYLGWYTPKGTRRWTKIDEYYEADTTRSAGQHADAVALKANEITGRFGATCEGCLCDPSGRAHVIELGKRGFPMLTTNNDVYNGLVNLQPRLAHGTILVHERCEALRGELDSYVWDEKAGDKPAKNQDDHAIDETRYFCSYAYPLDGGFIAPLD